MKGRRNQRIPALLRQLRRKQPGALTQAARVAQGVTLGSEVFSGPIEGNLSRNQRGGVAARVWLGTPGRSELVAGRLVLQEGVADQDRDGVVRELSGRLYQEIKGAIYQRTGLLVGDHNPPMDRIEWLVILDPDQESETRLGGFCEGWSQILPPGTRAHQLSGMQVQELARRMFRRQARDTESDQQSPGVGLPVVS